MNNKIADNVYLPVETDQLELKDLSCGDDWQELYKTICAFLNTKGGIIMIGIKEDVKNKHFKFTGFLPTQSTEEKIKNFSNLFTDKAGNRLDLSDYINDHKIKEEKLQKQEELVEELRNAVELELVPSVTIDDLDVEKLNDFIIRLNSDKKVETIKSDIASALSFLSRKKFIRNDNPTLLGMLVCGKDLIYTKITLFH